MLKLVDSADIYKSTHMFCLLFKAVLTVMMYVAFCENAYRPGPLILVETRGRILLVLLIPYLRMQWFYLIYFISGRPAIYIKYVLALPVPCRYTVKGGISSLVSYFFSDLDLNYPA